MSMFGQPQCFQFSSRISFSHQIPSKSKRKASNRKNFRPFNCLFKGIYLYFVHYLLYFHILSILS